MKINGFTLVEVMVANFVLVVVVVVGAFFWRFINQNFNFSLSHYRLTANATWSVNRISQELREAVDAMDGAYPLAILNDNEIAFYADIDNDELIERVRYFVEGTNLVKGVIKPSGSPPTYNLGLESTTVVVEQLNPIRSPIFTYYNGNWPGDVINNPLPLANRILETRVVNLLIPIIIEDSVENASFSASVVIQIRNLKDNL